MAKKAAGKGRADLPVSQDAQQRVPTTKLKPSALLDTRVVYCGDNLEQLANARTWATDFDSPADAVGYKYYIQPVDANDAPLAPPSNIVNFAAG